VGIEPTMAPCTDHFTGFADQAGPSPVTPRFYKLDVFLTGVVCGKFWCLSRLERKRRKCEPDDRTIQHLENLDQVLCCYFSQSLS
jgi:hypothetical protein